MTVLLRNAETVKNQVFLTWVIFTFQRLEGWFWDFNRDCIGKEYGNGQESRFSDLDYFHRLEVRTVVGKFNRNCIGRNTQTVITLILEGKTTHILSQFRREWS